MTLLSTLRAHLWWRPYCWRFLSAKIGWFGAVDKAESFEQIYYVLAANGTFDLQVQTYSGRFTNVDGELSTCLYQRATGDLSFCPCHLWLILSTLLSPIGPRVWYSYKNSWNTFLYFSIFQKYNEHHWLCHFCPTLSLARINRWPMNAEKR